MNKHLFVIFLTTFSCSLIAMDFPGTNLSGEATSKVSSNFFEPFVVAGCGLEITVKDLAESPSSSANPSPQSPRRKPEDLQSKK